MASDAEVYVVMGFLSVLSVVGTAGNAVVLYVFALKRDKLISTLFIIALAAVDFITCLVVIPATVYMEYVGFFITDDLSCKLYQFLIAANIPFSALTMVAIAVDRYLIICHPFMHVLTVGRAKVGNHVDILQSYTRVVGSMGLASYCTGPRTKVKATKV
jgi:hypothetical protein